MIRKDVIYLAIILILLGIVVVMTCQSPPEPVEDTRKYDSLIRVTREGEAKAIELAELRKADSLRSIESKKVYDLKVKKLESRISDLKANPVIIRIREEIPEVDSLIVAYDSRNQVKDDRIAELSGELYDCQKLAANAEENFKTTLQAQQGANAELVEDNKGLKKDLKNEKRKGKIARVFIPIALIGGFLLGNQ